MLAGGFFYLYKTTDIPDPNKDFEAQTTFVYYADGNDEAGPVRQPEPRVAPAGRRSRSTMQDAVVAAEDRTFYTNKGIDPKGILRAAFSNARGQRDPGRVDDHPAVRQDPLPHPGAHLTAQDQGGVPLAEDPAAAVASRRSSQGYLNTIYFGRGAYGVQAAVAAPTSTRTPSDLTVRECAVLASVLNSPELPRPRQRQGRPHNACMDATHYVLSGMVDDGHHLRRAGRPGRAAPAAPSPRSRRRTSTAARRATCSTMVKKELHALGFGDERIDGGGLRVTTTFTRKAMRRRRGRRAGRQARRRPEGAAHRRSRRVDAAAPARCAASTPARTT